MQREKFDTFDKWFMRFYGSAWLVVWFADFIDISGVPLGSPMDLVAITLAIICFALASMYRRLSESPS